MPRKEVGSREESRGKAEWLFDDPIYAACIRQCIGERPSGRQGYGAILVDKNGWVVSAARNMRVRADEPWRKMGYANHAEGMAIFLAEAFGGNVRGAVVYVAGVLESGLPLVFAESNFTCGRCARLMAEYGLSGIYTPTRLGWGFLATEEAVRASSEFSFVAIDNASGRHEINWMDNSDVAEGVFKAVLARTPRNTIDGLRGTGLRVMKEAMAILAMTTVGYVPSEILKERLIDLIS